MRLKSVGDAYVVYITEQRRMNSSGFRDKNQASICDLHKGTLLLANLPFIEHLFNAFRTDFP